jgi:cyclophilin family peptidyl-prolyl cis-trans isomerase
MRPSGPFSTSRSVIAAPITSILMLIFMCIGPVFELKAESAPFVLPPKANLLKLRSAEISTSRGTIYFELYPEDAPWHVANFKRLADSGFYSGNTFHIVQPGYIVQGGAIEKGSTEHSYTLEPEFNRHRHEPGSLGMARLPDAANPERRSDGHQFHILLSHAPHMNSSYTVFGKAVQGLDVLDELRQGDKILSVKVFVRD